jgi:hypothetical protein
MSNKTTDNFTPRNLTTVHVLGVEITLDTSIALDKVIFETNLSLQTTDRILFGKSQEAIRELTNLCTDLEADVRGDWFVSDTSAQINQLINKRAATRQSLVSLLYVRDAK